ncbi:MAG: hypothetical protein Q4C13_01575 [Clostridia bacterium]|nr:hypothetical protein [Clostridia bacterium]
MKPSIKRSIDIAFTVCLMALLVGFLIKGGAPVLEALAAAAEQTRANFAERGLSGEALSAEHEILVSVRDGLIADYDERFPGRVHFVNLNGALRRLLGQRLMNERVRLDNGYLLAPVPEADTAAPAESLSELHAYCRERDIAFLFMLAPSKAAPDGEALPAGVQDYAAANAERFLSLLRARGIPYMDVAAEMEAAGLPHYEQFFRTDHHWTPRAAFWSFARLADRLEESEGWETDALYTDAENYTSIWYEDWFLGSDGRRTGRYFAGTDDFELILPRFETRLSFSVPEDGIERSGSYAEAYIYWPDIEERNYFNLSPYSAYTGGDFPLALQRNLAGDTGRRLLLVRDSFACAIQPYLTFSFDEVDVVDLRYAEDFSLYAYVEETQPDMLLFLYGAETLANPPAFAFDG